MKGTAMFQLLEAERVDLTPAMAKKILDENNVLTAQRRINKAKSKLYAREMSNGTFRPAAIGLAVNGTTGQKVLVDGQHRLDAILHYQRPISASIETYQCKDDQGVALLYSTYNTDLSRGINDISAIYAELFGVGHWSARVRGWVVQFAAIMAAKDFKGLKDVTLQERSLLLQDYVDTGEHLHDLHGTLLAHEANTAFRNGNIAFCILHSAETASQPLHRSFWEAVLAPSEAVPGGTRINYNNPARLFRRTIHDAYMARGTGWWSTSAQARARTGKIYQRALGHFRNGKEVSKFTVSNSAEFKWPK